MQRTLSLDIYDYAGHALCNLYDSTNDIVGQAHDVYVHSERNGFKELRFSLPSTCEGEYNYRLDFLVSDYRIRFREVKNNQEEIDWFLISESKVVHNNFSMEFDIKASHISQLLTTKNLNLEFSDNDGNNTGTIGQIAATILEGTNWHLADVRKFYEEDKYNLQGKEKVRSFTASARTGAFKMMNDLCELFDAKPIYHGEGQYKAYVVRGTNPKSGEEEIYVEGLDTYAADRAVIAAESIGWTDLTVTEQGIFTGERTVDIIPMNPFSEKLESGTVPIEVLEGEGVLGLYYDKNVKNISRTLNTDSLVTVFSAYGSYGDLNGLCSLQNAEHAVLTFGSLNKKEYCFEYQNSLYYFKPTANTNKLKWSYLDFQSRSYVYDGTHLYKVYKEPQTNDPEFIEGTIEFVKNKVPYIMDFTYYDKVGLLDDNMFRLIAENQTQVPAAHIAAEEASIELSQIKEELFKTASASNGFLMLDILSSDIHNGYLRLTLNKSKYMDGVIYRSDYEEARRNYFTWNAASGITAKGEAISGIGAVIYIVHQGNPTTWEKSYAKAYGNGSNNYYRDSLNNIYELDIEEHYDRKEYSPTFPSASYFPLTGEPDIIYVDDSTTKTYIWLNNDYQEIKASNYAYGTNEFPHPDTITLWMGENTWHSGDKVYLFSADSIAGMFGPREDQVRSNKESIEETTKVSTEVHPIYFVTQNESTTEEQKEVCRKGYGWCYRTFTNSFKFNDLWFLYGNNGDTSFHRVYMSTGDENPEEIEYVSGYKYYYSTKRKMVYIKSGNTYKAIKETTEEKNIKKAFATVVDGCITQEILTKGMCERYNYSGPSVTLEAGGNYAFENEFGNYWLFTTDRAISNPSLVHYIPSTKKVWQDNDEHHILPSVEHSFMYLDFPKNNELPDTTFSNGSYDNGYITYEGDKKISNDIHVYANVNYSFSLPSGSIIVCYDENRKFLNSFTSSPFTTPNHAYRVQLVCNSVPGNNHYFRLTDYDKSLFCKDVKYTILDCTGAGQRTGLNNLMDEFIRLSHEAYEVKLVDLRAAQQTITTLTNNLARALGDMYREGWWQETKYVEGDESKLYSDALDNLKEVSHPQATYEISYLDLYGSDDNLGDTVKTDWADVDISYAAHLVDMDIDTNCWAYIDTIDKCYDNPWKTQIEINTRLSMIGQQSFTDVLAKIAEVANQVRAKQAVYDRAEYVGSAGQLAADRLEGLIQANKLYILGGTSNWYTDSKGNIVFEDADGNSAMMLTGRGLLISCEKDANGDWVWRTALSGKGFNCDVIATGEFSAKHILAGTITTDKLSSSVGQELEIGSNKALTLYATADGMRPAGSLLTKHPSQSDSWIAIGAKDGNNPAYIDIQSGGIVHLYGGSEINIESGSKLTVNAADIQVGDVSGFSTLAGKLVAMDTNTTNARNAANAAQNAANNAQSDADAAQLTASQIADGTISVPHVETTGIHIYKTGSGASEQGHIDIGATGSINLAANSSLTMMANSSNSAVIINKNGISIGSQKSIALAAGCKLSVNAADIKIGDVTGFSTLAGKLTDMDTKTSAAQTAANNANTAANNAKSDADAAQLTANQIANGTIAVPHVQTTGIHIYKDSNNLGHIDIGATGSVNMAANSSLTMMANSSNSAVVINKNGISIGSQKSIAIASGSKLSVNAADIQIGDITGFNTLSAKLSDMDSKTSTAQTTANSKSKTYRTTKSTMLSKTDFVVGDVWQDSSSSGYGYEYICKKKYDSSYNSDTFDNYWSIVGTSITGGAKLAIDANAGTINMVAANAITIAAGATISIAASKMLTLTTAGTISIGNGVKPFTIGATTGTSGHAYIYNGTSSLSSNTAGVYIGTDGIRAVGIGTFSDGKAKYAINFNPSNGQFIVKSGMTSINDTTNKNGSYIDSLNGISLGGGKFKVTNDGNATLTGSVTATKFILSDPSFSLSPDKVDGLTNAGVSYQYAVSSSGTTVPSSGWKDSRSQLTITTGKYVWTKIVTTALDGTKTTEYACEYYAKDGTNGTNGKDGKDGKNGTNGTNGKDGADGKDGGYISKVEHLYYLKRNTTAPSKPTREITSTSTASGAWRVVVPKYITNYTYFCCEQYTWIGRLDGDTMTWSEVYTDWGLTEANANATQASTDAAAASSTVEPFTHDGLSYGTTWGGKSYGVTLCNSSTAKPMLIGSNSGITIAKSATSSDGAALVIDKSGIALHGAAINLTSSADTTTNTVAMNSSGITIASGAKIQVKTGSSFTVESGNFGIDTSGNVTVKGNLTANALYVGNNNLISNNKISLSSTTASFGSNSIPDSALASDYYVSRSGIDITTNGVEISGSKHIKLDVDANNYVHMTSSGIEMKGNRVIIKEGNKSYPMWGRDDIVILKASDNEQTVINSMSGKHDWVLIKPFYDAQNEYNASLGVAELDVVSGQYTLTSGYSFGNNSTYQYTIDITIQNFSGNAKEVSVQAFFSNIPFQFTSSGNWHEEAQTQAQAYTASSGTAQSFSQGATLSFTLSSSIVQKNLCAEGNTIYYYLSLTGRNMSYRQEVRVLKHEMRAVDQQTSATKVPCTVYYFT